MGSSFITMRGSWGSVSIATAGGISVSDVGAIVLGVVAIAAMAFAFFYFRSIKAKRVDMHDRGIA